MTRFLLRRLVLSALTILAVAVISFLLMRAVRGGPFDEERPMHPAIQENLKRYYQLDQPLPTQFLQYIGGVLQGDFGPSLRMRDFTVNDILAQAFPISATLGLGALSLALVLGILIGVLSAQSKDSTMDRFGMAFSSIGIAIPNFVFASIFILLFAFWIPLFPPAGWGQWRHLFLPALTLSLPFAASIARLVRTGMIESLSADYIRTSKAKGNSQTQTLIRHALPGAMTSVISFLGQAGAGILTGSLAIEKIFAIPGLGTHFVYSALNRDYPLAMGITLLYTALVCLLNLLSDLVLALFDPRIQLE